MKEIIIAPSVLSLDYTDTKQQLKELDESKAKWVHFDVMDGDFVPNLTFGPDILKAFKKSVDMLMDVHIMVKDPLFISKLFIDAGADLITFHYEALEDDNKILEVINSIKARGCKVGISIKPNTNVEVLYKYIDNIDLVLVMSVEPGFGGQSFMMNSLDKVKELATIINDNNYECLIQIDGGINKETAILAKEAGVNVLVAGSYVFKGNIKENVLSLL